MKNWFLLSLALCFITLETCKKDDNSPTAEHFTAKIDGVDFNASTFSAVDGASSYNISGMNDQGEISFTILGDAAVGTYQIDGFTCSGVFTSSNGVDSWSAGSGSLVITKYENGRIEGTFQFVGEHISITDPLDDINATQGSFAIDE